MQHACRFMPSGTVFVHRADQFLGESEWQWCLVASREATEQDLLEDHRLETVGDIMWQAVIGIGYCPYCGVLLPGADPDNSNKKAAIGHSNL